LNRIAYFSMEFGHGEALPPYDGRLRVLAGDYLKTASDLGVTAIGVGYLEARSPRSLKATTTAATTRASTNRADFGRRPHPALRRRVTHGAAPP